MMFWSLRACAGGFFFCYALILLRKMGAVPMMTMQGRTLEGVQFFENESAGPKTAEIFVYAKENVRKGKLTMPLRLRG